MEIIEREKPKKLEPVSPINVFAGAKLNGKNPTNAPANAVINKIEISGEPFNTNIINNDTADMTEIPADSLFANARVKRGIFYYFDNRMDCRSNECY